MASLDYIGPPAALIPGNAPAFAPPSIALPSPKIAPLPGPATAASAGAPPAAVRDILAQSDPGFETFWARMVPGESGGRDVPNFRYDPGHTASGVAQITDTNWRAWAPKLGIDVSRYPTAMSAPADYQKAVAKLMHRALGAAPWDIAHGGSLPMQGAYNEVLDYAKQEAGIYGKAAEDMRKAHAEAMKTLGSLSADSPDFDKRVRQATERVDRATEALMQAVAQKPQVPTNQALQHFGSVATIVGMLGGLLTKQPLTGMLQAGAAAIGAANQGDWQRYHANLDAWKTQSEMLMRISQLQQQRLQQIVSDRHQTMNERLAQANAFLRANEMGYLADELEAKGPDALIRATDAWARMNQQMQNHYDMLQLRMAMLGARMGGALDQQTLDTMADQYIAGDKSVLQGLGYGTVGAQNRAALREAISRKMMARATSQFEKQHGRAPSDEERERLSADIGRQLALSIAEFGGLQQAERTGFGRVAQLTIGAAEAQKFTPLALSASDKVNRTQFPTLNAALLAVKEGRGDTSVINFVEANVALADAYAQVIGRGNAQLTDAARAQAMGLLNTAWSKGQYREAVAAINREINAALEAPREMLETFRQGFAAGGATLPELKIGEPAKSAPAAPAEAGSEYRSPDDVYRAFDDGKITKDEAKKILIDRFGFKGPQ